MPLALTEHHETGSSKSWWSMSNKHLSNSRYSSERPKIKSPLTLNSLASAFGFKSKKSPTLAIQDPPLPIQSPPIHLNTSPDPPKSINRPPSKSVSSTRSRADSVEPRTPSDVHYSLKKVSRQSLLTLSDIDPFAGRQGVTISSTDPTRLSAYSNGSGGDYDKHGQYASYNRVSYGSSSSQSHSYANLGDARSPISPSESVNSRLLKKASDSNLMRNTSYATGDRPVRPTTQPRLHKSGSSNTLTSSSTASTTRPVMRPRGLTDNVTTQKAGFFVDSVSKAVSSAPSTPPPPHRPAQKPPPPSAKPISPRVIIRQASLQRIIPPTAPPRHKLPAPPQSSVNERDEDDLEHPISAVSAANSTISFASPSPIDVDFLSSSVKTPERPRRISDRGFLPPSHSELEKDVRGPERRNVSQAPLTPPATLKKAISHQSLLKRGPLFSAAPHTPTTQPQVQTNTLSSQETPHKQRNFPHPRIPIPPIPLSLRHSNSSHSGLAEHNAVSKDQKRTSTSSHGGSRKRLFSGSSMRRPSTSQSQRAEDDNQSVFSMKSDQDLIINTAFFKPWISTQSSSASFWDEATPETVPNSPIRGTAELGSPQQVLQTSPISTLGRLEQINIQRQRGLSVRSADASITDSESRNPEPMRRFKRSNSTLPSGSSPHMAKKALTRPSTAQPAFNPADPAVPDPIEQAYKPSSSPPPMISSLPPPPRPRQRAQIVTQPEAISIPSRSPLPAVISVPLTPNVVSLPPPPSRKPSIKALSTIEKAMHRRSIMKKPSFLEIDDESDPDTDYDPVADNNIIGDSFLDFARESFDTVRSN
ncbi:hypothetical protein FA15DRAFT_751864 [Coprinopsis marcescibilis]|uniref:Uncharacterized protein n=1 Tax=Coprinopsis marcescibilis TaxID=230819 RepID=A0A5C3LDX0_COPMA|nr:hypothetical protein FA15DRAFT_751864 [Coprinopsis marcescibilis]